METFALDVRQLKNLSEIDQARLVEAAEQRIDEYQRSAPPDQHSQKWIKTQRKLIHDTLNQLIGR